MDIDLEKDIIIFIDETRVYIEWNVRCFYPKGEKNIRNVSSKKINLNSIGALSPNGTPHISFPERTNAFTIILFLLELFKKNTTDKAKIKELSDILSMADIDPCFVENEMKMELGFQEEDFTAKIDRINKLNISCENKKSRLEKLLNRFTVSSNKLLHRLRFNQKNVITNSNLSNAFNDIAIVWDNAKSHIANHVKDILNFFGVKLAPLPIKCPSYNPIEYPWADIKRETAKEPIDDEDELKSFFEKQYYTQIEKGNYTDYWFNLISEKRKLYASK